MKFPTSSISEVDAIKASPLFQLSLGSKELFHSNFIAWLAGKYPEQVGKILAPYLNDSTGNLTITRIDRELKNIDVHLYFANGQELILENKVKSIPYIEQLEAYCDGHTANQNFLLLTLTRPGFTQVDKIPVLDTFWHTMSYLELAGSLKTLIPQTVSQYDRLILEDYIFFITFISHALEKVEVTEVDYFTFYRSETDRTLSLLQAIRMADVYLKIKYQSLGALIEERLRLELPDAQIYFGSRPKELKRNTVYITTGMIRAQGLIDIIYILEDGLYLSIQLQANRYSQLLQGYAGYGKATRPYAERLLEQKQWFSFSHISETALVYPKNESKTFNKYGETDFYRSVNLSDEYTIKQIIDFITHDIKKMVSIR